MLYIVNCAILGHKTNTSVPIQSNMPVSELQYQIKSRNCRTLGSFDDSALELYFVDIPGDDYETLMESVSQKTVDYKEEQKLRSNWDALSTVFGPTGPSEKTLHILVKYPAVRLPAGSDRVASTNKRPLSPQASDEGAAKQRRVEDGSAALPRRWYKLDGGEPDRVAKAAAAFYKKTWGKQWPQHERKIRKTDISNEPDSADDSADGALADKLVVPDEFQYRFLSGMREVKEVLGANIDDDDILVIRQEYRDLYGVLETVAKTDARVGGFAVTGHPGIGKTTFLYYVLLYRLELKLPTAIQLSKHKYFIFDEHGAVVRPINTEDLRLKTCWALADSNILVTHPCDDFLSMAPFIVQTTSPKEERWKKWVKQKYGRWIVVDPPSVSEIAAILKELGYQSSPTLSFVRKYGPSTRQAICCAARIDSTNALDRDIQGDVETLCAAPMAVFGPKCLPRSEGSSVIFVRRPLGDIGSEKAISFIPTRHLRQMFEIHCCRVANQHSLNLFCSLSSHALTRTAAGWAHEKAMHTRLGTAGTALAIFANGSQSTMQPSAIILPGTLGSLSGVELHESFYWMPSSSNFPGVDSVLGTLDGGVYIIQATIATDHKDPKEGITKVWSSFNADVRAQRTWHYIVVADTQQTAASYVEMYSKSLSAFTLGINHTTVQVWGCLLAKSRFCL